MLHNADARVVKESLVGVEVFGRAPGYDTRSNSVVHTEAAKLRTRLSEYYAGEGASDPVLIQLPKGGYTPVFRREAVREIATITSAGVVPRRGKWRWVLPAFAGPQSGANSYFLCPLRGWIALAVAAIAIVDHSW